MHLDINCTVNDRLLVGHEACAISFVGPCHMLSCLYSSQLHTTVKILKFGTPQTIAMIVLKIEKFDVTLH